MVAHAPGFGNYFRSAASGFQESRREAKTTASPATPGATSGNPNTLETQPTTPELPRSPNGIKLPDEIKAGLLKLQEGQTPQSTKPEGQIVREGGTPFMLMFE